MAEAYALLATIRSAQEKYYAEYGEFLASTNSSFSPAPVGTSSNESYYGSNEEVLGINAMPNKYYTYFCVNGGFLVQGTPNNNYPYTHRKNAFLAYVTGRDVPALKMYYNLTESVQFY